MDKHKKQYFEVIVLTFYSFISFIWIWLHEPWRDEAQAWLIVRDLNLVGIFKQLAYEGTPGLWHLLLIPLAKLGLPYSTEFILHWCLAVVAMALFIFKSPFNRIIKVIFVFSYYCFYEYVLIARNYNLTILLLFAIAAFYNKRFKFPVLFSVLVSLLFNANIHSFWAAGALVLIFFWEIVRGKEFTKNNIIAILIMMFGGLLAILQISSGNSQNALVQVSFINFSSIFRAIGNAFLPYIGESILLGFFFAIVLLFMLFRFIERPKIFAFFIISIGWLLFVFGVIHRGELRQHGLIIVLIIFSLWLEKYYRSESINFIGKKGINKFIKNSGYLILAVSLLISIFTSFKIYWKEYKFNFSGSKEAASFIKENISVDQIIVAHRSYACSSILPNIPNHKFWYADIEEYGSFLIWNEKFKKNAYSLSNKEVIERANNKFGDNSNKIYLLTSPILDLEFSETISSTEQKDEIISEIIPLHKGELKGVLALLYNTKKTVFNHKDEIFYIYKEKHEN